MKNMVTCTCDWCGKSFERQPARLKGKKHIFCSRDCLAAYSNKSKNPHYSELKNYDNMRRNMTEINRKLNPTRMTDEVREKLSLSRLDSGHADWYRKRHGRHEHRAVAEQILGRELLPGEVVHHIDGNKKNNAPENLMMFRSQAEHAAYHKRKGVIR